MCNSRDCCMVVTDRDLIFGMKIALGQAANEKSPKLENVAMVTKKYGNADFWALFDPKGWGFDSNSPPIMIQNGTANF